MIAAGQIFLGRGGGGSVPSLPDGATEVDYVSANSSATAYVDLMIYPSFSLVYDFETEVYDTNYQNKTICAALDTSPSFVWFFIAQTFNNKLDMNYGTNGADDAGITCFTNRHRCYMKCHVENGLQQGWVTDITSGGSERLVTNTRYTGDSSYIFSAKLRLFNRTNLSPSGVYQMGRTKLSVDSVLLYDLVPCLYEGSYIFWNLVTNSAMEMTGNFTGGYWQ